MTRWHAVSRLLLALLPALAGGCAINPHQQVVDHGCQFRSYDLAVEQQQGVVADASARPTLADKLHAALFSATPAPDATAPSQSMLFLSGGSQHGAFGAGFLADWQRLSPGGVLPDFKVVTGISTGAILSTFAFVNQPERAVAGYTIDKEGDLLKPLGPVKNGEPTAAAYIKLLQKGALGDLSPLRGRLRAAIDDAMLREVAAQGARGRLLLIGVVDVDTGQAVVLDLTDMAAQFVAATDPVTRTAKHDCYIEGVLASSSAPLAAAPVFIDNREYVDGGARFGMFSDEIGNQITAFSADASAKPTITLLINGDQETKGQCGKKNPADCPGGNDPAGNVKGEHADWSFPSLAVRSESILTNQVYRFSAARVEQSGKDRNIPVHVVKIDAQEMMRHLYPRQSDGTVAPGAKSCSDWHDIDRQEVDPLQFYPKYMRCVIDYGRSRVPGEMAKWQASADGGPF